MSNDRSGRVLIVDDNPEVLELFAEFLEDAYEVEVASSGGEALEVVSEDTDVVLLDRRMPGMKGQEVLEAIREREYDCRVAMVTAVQPEPSIAQMGFDDYVMKPVTQSKLVNVVDSLLRWNEFDDVLKEYFEAARKVTVLKEEHPEEKLEASDDYRRLKDRLSTLRAEADDVMEGLESEAFEELADAVEEISDSSEPPIRFSEP